MASSYPPPEDSHYPPIYPATPSGQLLDNGQQPQLPYSPPNIYPKLEGSNDMQQQLQQLQQQAHQANHALSASPHVADQQPKPNRLRKACDSCSIRKVKCDESGPPCRACASLEIPCTFERPSRRRGPPNRHAEAIKKKRRLDEPGSGPSTPASPTNAAHALAQLSSHPPHLSAESICSLPTMNALIDDFFTYIHPLCPFPHEPSFREAWERREDYSNPSFLGLLSSMIACLVASFPRKPRLHLKSQTRDNKYPSHLSLVDKCREVCAQARGTGYLDKPHLNVYDACTSYFLGLTGAYIFQWRQLRLYFGECLTILRSLGLHKAQEQGYTHLGGLPGALGSTGPNYDGSQDLTLDKITEQISRRLFWTLFVGVRTLQQLGASFGELTILPATPTEQHPPLPVEVDDPCIFPHEIVSQPPGVVSLITGFNTNVRIYTSYSSLSTAEMAFGIDELFDWSKQQKILQQSLQRCRQVFDEIPDDLKVLQKDTQNGQFGQRKHPYYPPISEYGGVRDPNISPSFNGFGSLEERRSAQYEIQKANIYASHLSIRSYLVEKYFALQDKYTLAATQAALQGSPSALASGFDRLVGGSEPETEMLEKSMAAEREQVVKDLLVVLGSIDMVNMEPNGDSFTQKIRSIASTLLEAPKDRQGSIALQHQEYLYKFLDILSKLERVSPETSDLNGGGGLIDEESELRAWADLREYQLKFQEQGGVYGFS